MGSTCTDFPFGTFDANVNCSTAGTTTMFNVLYASDGDIKQKNKKLYQTCSCTLAPQHRSLNPPTTSSRSQLVHGSDVPERVNQIRIDTTSVNGDKGRAAVNELMKAEKSSSLQGAKLSP